MSGNKIERQPTQGLANIQGQRARHSGQTVNRAQGQHTVGDVGNSGMLNSILSAAGNVASGVSRELKQKKDSAKLKGRYDAMTGQIADTDASDSYNTAHALVGAENNIIQATSRIREASKTFEGTDDEWTEYMDTEFKSAQDSTFEASPILRDDEKAQTQWMGTFTNIVGEQLSTIAYNRQSDKLSLDKARNIKTLESNFTLKSEELKGEALENTIREQLEVTTDALALTRNEYEATVVSAAYNQAVNGNVNLVNALKNINNVDGVSLYDANVKLQKAEKAGIKLNVSNASEVLAKTKLDLEDDFVSGRISTDKFLAEAGAMNDRTSNSAYTAEGMMSVVRRTQSATSQKINLENGSNTFNNVGHEGVKGTLATSNLKPKQQQDVINTEYAKLIQSVDAAVEHYGGPLSDEDARKSILNEKMLTFSNKLASNGVVSEKFRNTIQSMMGTPIDVYNEDGSAPEQVGEAISLMNTLPPETLRATLSSDKEFGWATNFKRFQESGMSQAQAAEKANAIKMSPPITDRKTKDDIASVVSKQTEDIFDTRWFSMDDGTRAHQKARISNQIEIHTMALVRAGTPVDDAGATASATFNRTHFQVEDGTYIKGNQNTVASLMRVHPNDISKTLEYHKDANKEKYEQELAGEEMEGIYYDIQETSGSALVRTATGTVIDRVSLNEIAIGRDAYLQAKLEEDNASFLTQLHSSLSYKSGKSQYTPTTPVGFDENVTNFNDAMKTAENGIKSGFNNDTGVWSPHKSPEGGEHTLAYGHKLSAKEVKQGYIEVDGENYSFREGQNQITEDIADKIYQADKNKAVDKLTKNWKGFDKLPQNMQQVLTNIQFNVKGSVTATSWPKLSKAIESGDTEAIKKEMLTSYKKAGSTEFTELEGRRDTIFNSIKF